MAGEHFLTVGERLPGQNLQFLRGFSANQRAPYILHDRRNLIPIGEILIPDWETPRFGARRVTAYSLAHG
jgi:hypothetical protein